jgi:hypothetical protein
MFRQDYRINKIFLPYQKKGKKHHPSSREGVHSLRPQNSRSVSLTTYPCSVFKENIGAAEGKIYISA